MMKSFVLHRHVVVAILLVCALGLLIVRWWTVPHVLGGTLQHTGGTFPFSHIALADVSTDMKVVDMEIFVPPLALQRTYVVHTSSCAREFLVNDQRVKHERLCLYTGTPVDLSHVLVSGLNRVHMTFDPSFTFHFLLRPQAFFWLTTFVDIAIAVCMAAATWLMLRRKGWFVQSMVLMVLGGILLRAWYWEATPYFVRAWDWDDHLKYIQYMMQHWEVPSAKDGYQFFQAPLYYVVAAAWGVVTGAAGTTRELLIAAVRPLSFFLSITTLALCVWIADLLFPHKSERHQRLILVAIVAVFPGVLFFASRVSNETLLFPLSLLSFGALIQWWRTNSSWWWHANTIVIALGLLTKTTMLPLAFAPIVCLLLSGQSVRARVMLFGSFTGIVVATSGWLMLTRYFIDGYYDVVQTASMRVSSPGLFTVNNFANLLTFHPLKVIAKPFNWNWAPEYRPQMFLEYFFKSGYTGEWPQHPHALWPLRALLALHMAGLGAAVVGLWHEIRTNFRSTLPILITGFMLLSVMTANRVMNQYLTGQDYRYIPLILIPVVYYIVRGMNILENKTKLRLYWLAWLYCAIALAYMFVLIRDGTILIDFA